MKIICFLNNHVHMQNMDFCRSSPTTFINCPKNSLKITANISHSGNWILLNVYGYSDGIIDTTAINQFSLVMWPLTTSLYYEIIVVSPCCLFKLQVLHKIIMPYHSAWHYTFLCFIFHYMLPIQLKEHIPTEKYAGLEASRWQPHH